MKPHLKVPRKASRKVRKGVYYASEFFLPFFRAPLGAFSCELIKLSDLYWAVFPLFPIISVRTAVIVVCFICPNCLSLRDNAACCIPLCVICVICGRITRKLTQSTRTNETPMSPADLADLRRQTTKHKTALTSTNSILSATSAGE